MNQRDLFLFTAKISMEFGLLTTLGGIVKSVDCFGSVLDLLENDLEEADKG